MNDPKNILIVAGEVSGDMHGAELVKEIKASLPNISFFGIGGSNMRAEGVETLHGVSEMAVMGFTEVLKKYPFFRRVFNEVLDEVDTRKPDAAILIDYPGFNLRLARKLHQRGIIIIYYVCPQVWAWHQSRIKMMSEIIDQLITIFPFENKYFADTNLNIGFAGHPLVDKMPSKEIVDSTEIPWNGQSKVALLPGSRSNEIDRLLPVMWKAAAMLEEESPETSFIIAAKSEKTAKLIQARIDALGPGPQKYAVVAGKTEIILGQADAAMVASGTATVEASLMTCPMVIIYKTSALTYLLGRMLIKVKNIGMVNILAGSEICPEFFQYEAKEKAIASAITPLLRDTPARKEMLNNLEKVNQSLGSGNASKKAAKMVVEALAHTFHEESRML